MKLTSRKEAMNQGLSRYFTGKPCKNGHVSERIASSRTCADCHRAASDKWRGENMDKARLSVSLWASKNPEKIKIKSKENYERNKTPRIVRGMIARVISNWSGGRSKCEIKLGYTIDELRSHLEGRFLDGMSWENWSRHGWHIDHIKPIKAFLDEGITDPKIINALSNLQPLWAKDNLRKGSTHQE